MSLFTALFDQFEPDEWVAIATIALVVVTALLASIAYIQIITTRRQLRAYITIDPGNVIRQNRKNNFELQPFISNRGSIPAFEVKNSSELAILPFPLPPSTKLPITPSRGSIMTLGPGQTRIVFAGHRRFSLSELREIYKGTTRRLYVYGRIQYFDTFQSPRWFFKLFPRYTNFCYSIMWHPNRGCLWIQSERHNDAN